MTNDCTSAFEAIRIAAQNYVDTPTLVAAGRVQTADLTRVELVMLVAGFAASRPAWCRPAGPNARQ